jgi:hypothetical protein
MTTLATTLGRLSSVEEQSEKWLAESEKRLAESEERLAESEKQLVSSERLLSATRGSLALNEHALDDLKRFKYVVTCKLGMHYKSPKVFVYPWKISFGIYWPWNPHRGLINEKFYADVLRCWLRLHVNFPSGYSTDYRFQALVCEGK